MTGRHHIAVALSAAALAGTGCARDEEKTKPTTDKAASARVDSISADDRAQQAAGAALAKDGSAGAAALMLVRDVRDGAGPVLLPAYDSRILERIGVSDMMGALDWVRQLTQGTTPVVVRQRKASSGHLVVVRLMRQEGEDRGFSFLLRRNRGRWIIAYDSLLAEGLQSYVPSARAKDPAKPSRAAIKAGTRAVSELRLAARNPPTRDEPTAERSPSQASPSAP